MSFNTSGDDMTDFVVDSRDFQEVAPGEFGIVVSIRRIPRPV